MADERQRMAVYLEGELLQGLGQAGERLVPGAGLGNESQSSGGAGQVTAGELDARVLAGLVLERA